MFFVNFKQRINKLSLLRLLPLLLSLLHNIIIMNIITIIITSLSLL